MGVRRLFVELLNWVIRASARHSVAIDCRGAVESPQGLEQRAFSALKARFLLELNAFRDNLVRTVVPPWSRFAAVGTQRGGYPGEAQLQVLACV
jgi:hypothetical protein